MVLALSIGVVALVERETRGRREGIRAGGLPRELGGPVYPRNSVGGGVRLAKLLLPPPGKAGGPPTDVSRVEPPNRGSRMGGGLP
jgi:hypothetical protein